MLRREVPLREDQIFSRDLLDFGRRRVNQLGYWQAPDEPIVEPDEETQTVNVTIAGEEQGRNEIQLGGGFSGLNGAFFNGVYSTRNFLGRGQTLSTSIQVGGRFSRYQVAFQEPFFLNRPILLGANIFRTDTEFGDTLQSSSTGFGVTVGRRLGRFSRINVGYSFQRLESDSFVRGDDGTSETVEAATTLSSITPVFRYSTINNPFRPTRGEEFRFSVQVAGGAVGGTSDFVRPQIDLTSYTPLGRSRQRAYFAQHVEVGFVSAYGSGTTDNSAIVEIPRASRFWLGGDIIGPRVFDNRSIVPRRDVIIQDGNFVFVGDDLNAQAIGAIGADGAPAQVIRGVEVGGDRFFLYQAELVFPLNEQIDLVGFVDMGDALFEDQSLGFATARVSAGAELRFNLPIFPVPLRLIYGVPVRQLDTDRTQSFQFSVGRTF